MSGGRRFGAYVLEQELASGGQGAVWRARHGPTGQPVALKLLAAPGEAAAARFAQEARVLARLGHPNIVAVFDHGVVEGTPFLATELVVGQDLKALVEARGRPTPAFAARVLALVARALQHCHERGVVHRDVKPANVLLEQDGERPVLVDFGLVKRDPAQLALPSLDDDRQVELSLSGSLKGTPEFMAPEQVHPRHGEVGPATDVHGLGATLYFLLTGRPPFVAASFPALLRAVTRQAPPDPAQLGGDPALARVALQALAKDPRQRFPTAEAFAAALLATGLGAGAEAAAAAPARTASGRLPAALPGGAGPRPGGRLGPFTVVRELGRGAMGVVLEARADDGAEVALKLMTGVAGDPRARRRFEREVAALRALEHPNVVRLAGASLEGTPWLAMELVRGRDLQRRLDDDGPLAGDEAAAVVAQVARGVAHAHARGVLHRDLKPSNVLVRDRDGVALVSDFGLARSLEASRFTRTGDAVGTLAYMSPEQVQGRRDDGPAADVWALGAILFRCLTGEPPFAGESALGLAAAIVQEPVRRPSALRRDVPADLEATCLACLQRDPDRRPTALAVAQALTARRGLDRPRGRPRAAVLAALGAAALAVAGAVAVVAPRRPAAPGAGGPPPAPAAPGTEAAPPGTDAPPPGTDAPPPRTDAPPPRTEAPPPGTDAAPPGTEAAPPGADAAALDDALARARAATRAFDGARALAAADEALALAPGSAAAALARARALDLCGRFEEARVLLDARVADRDRRPAEAYEAVLLYSRLAPYTLPTERQVDVAGLLRLAIELAPDRPEAYLRRAKTLLYADATRGRADVERALALEPDGPEALADLVLLEFMDAVETPGPGGPEPHLARAERTLARLLERAPDDPRAFTLRAMLAWARRADPEGQTRDLRRAMTLLRRRGGPSRHFLDLAWAALEADDATRAVWLAQRARAEDLRDPLALTVAALALARCTETPGRGGVDGDLRTARELLDSALGYNAACYEVMLVRAWTHAIGQPATAQSLLRSIEEVAALAEAAGATDEVAWLYHRTRAELLRRAGRAQAAEVELEAYRRAWSTRPRD